eukprot:TRINITY_DN11772_c0_g1_i1.p1 TRINITY_DN11772_c0_g1~~TRINITY_DN11772_c0_g1_i1.p1  ORF type:complete len:458 (+),score=132.51 TRINITY_DN11772_c0_g1_i1:441-1814(+)
MKEESITVNTSPMPVVASKLKKWMIMEEEIRRKKLRNMQRIKGHLEEKLHSVNATVQLLKSSPMYSSAKPRLLRYEEPRDQFHKKCMEAEEFVERMQIEREMYEEEKAERDRIWEEKKQKRREEAEEKARRQKELAQQRHKNEILNAYRRLRKERELQQVEWNKAQQNLPPKKNTYLYKRYEKKHQKEVVLPSFEKAKLELLKKKQLYKSVTSYELAAHKQIHDQKIIERGYAKKQELLARQQVDKAFIEHQKHFQTKISKTVKLIDEKKRNKALSQQIEKEVMYQKMKNYANIVKDVCKIHNSKKKAEQLQASIKKLKHPVRPARDVKKEYSLANLNMPTRHRSPIKRSNSLAYIFKAKPAVNYLPELKRKRIEKYEAQSPPKCNWSADLEDLRLSTEEKYKKISSKVNMMEQHVKMREHLMSNTKKSKEYIDKEKETSDLLLNIIKAKLAMYDKL